MTKTSNKTSIRYVACPNKCRSNRHIRGSKSHKICLMLGEFQDLGIGIGHELIVCDGTHKNRKRSAPVEEFASHPIRNPLSMECAVNQLVKKGTSKEKIIHLIETYTQTMEDIGKGVVKSDKQDFYALINISPPNPNQEHELEIPKKGRFEGLPINQRLYLLKGLERELALSEHLRGQQKNLVKPDPVITRKQNPPKLPPCFNNKESPEDQLACLLDEDSQSFTKVGLTYQISLPSQVGVIEAQIRANRKRKTWGVHLKNLNQSRTELNLSDLELYLLFKLDNPIYDPIPELENTKG